MDADRLLDCPLLAASASALATAADLTRRKGYTVITSDYHAHDNNFSQNALRVVLGREQAFARSVAPGMVDLAHPKAARGGSRPVAHAPWLGRLEVRAHGGPLSWLALKSVRCSLHSSIGRNLRSPRPARCVSGVSGEIGRARERAPGRGELTLSSIVARALLWATVIHGRYGCDREALASTVAVEDIKTGIAWAREPQMSTRSFPRRQRPLQEHRRAWRARPLPPIWAYMGGGQSWAEK